MTLAFALPFAFAFAFAFAEAFGFGAGASLDSSSASSVPAGLRVRLRGLSFEDPLERLSLKGNGYRICMASLIASHFHVQIAPPHP